MPLPIPDLDDRRFDDLVAELSARLQAQLPELSRLAPGDPAHALVDLFAWLTETILYRANRIPERQRAAFLNLLQIPLRPARPARGVVCIDALPSDSRSLPPLLASESLLKAGKLSFTTVGEVQPTPLELRVMVKTALSSSELAAIGVSLEQLRAQYPVEPQAFRPTTLIPAQQVLSTAGSVDKALHLAFTLPKRLAPRADRVRQMLAGIVLNLAIAPLADVEGDLATTLSPRRLDWELAWWPDPDKEPDRVEYLPLERVADSSLGGRRSGTVRLRLPRDGRFLRVSEVLDPQFAGMGDTPPEAPTDLAPGQMLFWLRLSSRDGDDIELGYLGVNGVDVLGQGVIRDLMLGIGNGRPDQVVNLHGDDVDAASVQIEVEEAGRFVAWTAVEQFMGSPADERVFVVSGAQVRFGDGVRGRRPAEGARIRAAYYRYGGGNAGNLPADSIKSLQGGSERLKVRHEWPSRGGVDAESLADAERRIPAFLSHRERAVTAEDFAILARDNPLRPIARADALPGFFPGSSLKAVRRGLPGVISLFVLPHGEPALAAAPRPSAGSLRDVFEYLSARTLLGTELYVLSPQYQPVAISVSLEVVDPQTQEQTYRAVELALLRYLWPLAPYGLRGQGWPRGRSVEINELRTQAGRVDGVEAVNGLRLFYQDLDTLFWRELRDMQALPLTDYQLPELMTVAIQSGEALPAPPPGYSPASSVSDSGAGSQSPRKPTPVPVIPDIC